MKNKALLFAILPIITTSLISCNGTLSDNSSSESFSSTETVSYEQESSSNNQESISSESDYSESVINEIFITWENYDGSYLSSNIVCEGDIPSYGYEDPTRESKNGIRYIFVGWSPEVTPAVKNTTYTACYIEVYENEVGQPELSTDGKTIKYGLYPQSHVSDEQLISSLSTLQPLKENGWYYYEENYYVKEIANVFNNESFKFDDNETIVNGKEYWFKCEPITWKVLESFGNKHLLLSQDLLDTHAYYKDFSERLVDEAVVYSNNYEQSDIRKWLNEEFYDKAFSINNKFVLEYTTDNGRKTTNSKENPYVCKNTLDKVFLLSYQDYYNQQYGFDDNYGERSATRYAKVTDYARIKGAWCNKSLNYNGTYWTRTPDSNFSYTAFNVNSGGFLSAYAVDGANHCVRPSVVIVV